MNYILITPVRNEEKYIRQVARSVIDQKVRPALWLIINDGSTDQTQAVIDELISECSWIVFRTLSCSSGGLGFHYAKVVNFGFEEIKREAHNRGIDYELIGKVDADVIFPTDCFQELILEFELDPKLGIASPSLCFASSENIVSFNANERLKDLSFEDHPTDGVRLYRNTCFDEIGGMQIVRAPEVVAEAKAVLLGWKLRRFGHIKALHRRVTHSSTSLWTRWKMRGSERYYLGYGILLFLGSCIWDFFTLKPAYLALANFWGYLNAFLRREERIKDLDVRAYFGNRRLFEITKLLPGLLGIDFKKKQLRRKSY